MIHLKKNAKISQCALETKNQFNLFLKGRTALSKDLSQ
jgi:hypothetical protein